MSKRIYIVDETLRDGLQAPYVRRLGIEERLQFIIQAIDLGIDVINVGYPGVSNKEEHIVKTILSSKVMKEAVTSECEVTCSACASSNTQVEALLRAANDIKLNIRATLYDTFYEKGYAVTPKEYASVYKSIIKNIKLCLNEAIPVTFVFEHGAYTAVSTLVRFARELTEINDIRYCIADSAGKCFPRQVYSQVNSFVCELNNSSTNDKMVVEWHGHEDLNLGVANAIEALSAGASSIHCCALGIGERVGNVSTEALVANLVAINKIQQTRIKCEKLKEYSIVASNILNMPISNHLPVVSPYAFCTATGRHARILEAQKNETTTDYNCISPKIFKCQNNIVIGPYSGHKNIQACLEQNKIPYIASDIECIFNYAKTNDHVLSLKEISDIILANRDQKYVVIKQSKDNLCRNHVCIVAIGTAGTLGHITSAIRLSQQLKKTTTKAFTLSLIVDQKAANLIEEDEIDNIYAIDIPGEHRGSIAGDLRTNIADILRSIHTSIKPNLYIFDTFYSSKYVRELESTGIPCVFYSYQFRDSIKELFYLNKVHKLFSRVLWLKEPYELYHGTKTEKVGKNEYIVPPIPLENNICSNGRQVENIKILVLCGGGGRPGAEQFLFEVIRALDDIDYCNQAVVISGPFNPISIQNTNSRPKIYKYQNPINILAAIQQANIVISEAGYHTCQELCTFGNKSLLVPGKRKIDNQEIRAIKLSKYSGFKHMFPEDINRNEVATMLNSLMKSDNKINRIPIWSWTDAAQPIVSLLS